MCLTHDALILFLTFLSPEIVDLGDTRIVVRAEVETTEWRLTKEGWCTGPDGARPPR